MICLTTHYIKDFPLSPNFMSALNEQVNGDWYKNMPIQVVEYCHANKIDFLSGCVIKYMSRWKLKNGVEDLKKAKHFVEILIELEEKEIKNGQAREMAGMV